MFSDVGEVWHGTKSIIDGCFEVFLYEYWGNGDDFGYWFTMYYVKNQVDWLRKRVERSGCGDCDASKVRPLKLLFKCEISEHFLRVSLIFFDKGFVCVYLFDYRKGSLIEIIKDWLRVDPRSVV